ARGRAQAALPRAALRVEVAASLPRVRASGRQQGLGARIRRRAARVHRDGENDRELLDWAGFGVAVANAHPEILARAQLVVPSVDDEGVALLFDAYLDSRA